jgi:hypothetical protein
VISDSNLASKLGAGDAGGGFFRVKSLGMPGGKSCVREISGLFIMICEL